ncbi:hypothetical protein [Bacillus thuringiensis]|uniref:Uncharacterized protein n=1 Tax=Bacillus thuringiensis TaxID=1428 RepID=A0A9X6WI56_BACTU|nr:hypothetical protein [Bacillus thuringiensis]PFJ29073.1 hypothetical protein COJ15_32940 [Bacillus thuringiensis]
MIIIKELSLNLNEEDKVLAEGKSLDELPYLLEELGFKDCKTKINENGTKLYYKGKRALYVHYKHK